MLTVVGVVMVYGDVLTHPMACRYTCMYVKEAVMKASTAKLFATGGSQAVGLPAEFLRL
jgi:hypothetical protein